eukprot:jgi/Botrbrau1/10761/Bobra.180_2s0026.1
MVEPSTCEDSSAQPACPSTVKEESVKGTDIRDSLTSGHGKMRKGDKEQTEGKPGMAAAAVLDASVTKHEEKRSLSELVRKRKSRSLADDNGQTQEQTRKGSSERRQQSNRKQDLASLPTEKAQPLSSKGAVQAAANHKWRKLGIVALKAKGGRMKVKKLQNVLLKQAGLSPGDQVVAGLMLKKWKKSDKIRVLNNGYVELCVDQ